MLTLVAFAIQAAFTAQHPTTWANNPYVVVPPSTAVHWYDLNKPHTLVLGYNGPNAPHGGVRAEEAVNAYGPLVHQRTIQGFYPSDIRNAYKVTGMGANAICVVDFGHLPTALGDFNSFSAQFGLPQETSSDATAKTNKVFQVVYDAGTPPPSNVADGWGFEEALDFEWAHAMAPNAKIYVIESSTGNLGPDNQIAAALPGVREVSNSWIDYGEDGPGELQEDKEYVYPGVVFFSGSGDIGALQGYPSESPNIVSCGGTSVFMNSTFTSVVQETGWIDGGGGPSDYEPRPAYQNDPRIAQRLGAFRGDPDLSAVADPNTGVAIFSNSYGGWNVVGGTSVATPVLAGIVNASNTFYPSTVAEEGLIYSRFQTSSFRDIVEGESTDGTRTFQCLPGWDYVTGCGSPLNLARPTVTYNGNLTSAVSVTGKNATNPPGGSNNGVAVADLQAADNVFYTVNGALFPPLGATGDVRVGFVLTGANVSPANAGGATITVTAKCNYTNVINEIFLYNTVSKNYDLVATPLLTTTEAAMSVTLSPAQSQKYIDSNGNVSVLSRALLPQSQFNGANSGFLYSIDRVAVSYQFFIPTAAAPPGLG